MAARGGSIKSRLVRMVLATTVGALVLAFGLMMGRDYQRFEEAVLGRADTLARVTGINTAVALSFLDPASATQTLSALSAAEPVIAAVIYDAYGEEFARYTRDGVSFRAPPVTATGHRIESGHLDLSRPIRFDGKEIGRILIRWDTSELQERMTEMAVLGALLLLALVALASFVSAWLQRAVSRPLGELMMGSRTIAAGDLSVRVPVSTSDEIGELGGTFNTMGESLRQLVSQVGHSVRDVGEVVHMLEDSGETLRHSAERQATATAETTGSIDETGQSIRGVNENVENLSESMRGTSSSIAEMQASITEVAGHMDHLAGSIETTSAAVNQVAANTKEVVSGVESLKEATGDSTHRVDQLGRSVQQVKANAQASHELSADASQEALRGLEAVRETIASMGEISSSFRDFETRINGLAQNSENIDTILGVIREIVDRTSLLSLNASIIAAQAGEHGKAFSVVADEVSNLAQSTQRSTLEIAELIRAVQQDTSAAVTAAEAGAAKVELGVQRSNVAGEVLQAINEKSQLSVERVREILEASSAQVDDLRSVEQALTVVSQIVDRFARSARDQQNATSEIAASIENIRLLGLEVQRSTDEQRQGSSLITKAVGDVSDRVGQIVEATQAQTRSLERIEHALEVFREVAGETGHSVESINRIVALLSERAARLDKEIGRFRIE